MDRVIILLTGLLLLGALVSAAAATPDGPVTYANTVKALMQQHCVECHRPGQAAPMALRTYEEVRPWAKSIAQQVAQRLMPPFHAAGPIGRYQNDLRLTDEAIESVLKWERQGAPRGDLGAELISAEKETLGWAIGQPDIVIEFPEHIVDPEATESDPYIESVSDYVFKNDLWVERIEWQFSNHRAIHHATVRYAVPVSGPSTTDGQDVKFDKGIIVHGWLPGQSPDRLPQGSAMFIAAGTQFMVIAHYAPESEAMVSRIRLGLHLFDGELRAPRWLVSSNIRNLPFKLAPGVRSHTETLLSAIPFDAHVYAFNVHMHYRGKRASISLNSPTGERAALFEIPNYDFDWQRTYVLNEPIRVAKNTEVKAVLEWDNSDENPANPDPTKEVRYGADSADEMGGVQIGIVAVNEGGETIRVNQGVSEIPTSELPEAFTPQLSAQIKSALENMTPERREALIRKALERRQAQE